MVEYSLDAEFDDLTDRDHSVEMIGYVDEITAPAEVGRGPNKFKLFKFVLNNNGTKRIQCLIWGDELINRYQSDIKIQEIVHIDGGHAKATLTGYHREALNLVPFEIIIQRNTILEFLGSHEVIPHADINPIDVTFDNVLEAVGLIRIHGFIKTKFAESPSRYGANTYGYGSITNGTHKITVDIVNYQPTLNFGKCDAVVVVGEIKMNGGILTLSCASSSEVTPDEGVQSMDIATTVRANQLFKRRHSE